MICLCSTPSKTKMSCPWFSWNFQSNNSNPCWNFFLYISFSLFSVQKPTYLHYLNWGHISSVVTYFPAIKLLLKVRKVVISSVLPETHYCHHHLYTIDIHIFTIYHYHYYSTHSQLRQIIGMECVDRHFHFLVDWTVFSIQDPDRAGLLHSG